MTPRRLTGDARARYCERVVALLRAARLNRDWPDVRRLAAHVEALHPRVDDGLYPHLDVDPRAGLPTYPMWQRVQTDAELAPDALAELPDEATLAARAEGQPDDSPHRRRLARARYYRRLVDRPLAVLGALDIKLRRLEPDTDTAHLHLVFDKLDQSGLFVRFTVDLAQQGAGIKVARVDADVAHETPALRALVYQSSGLDAELLLLQLARLEGVSVERVSKGTVGPLVDAPEGAVAHFAHEIAAIDLHADRICDPMHRAPAAAALGEREAARARFGYHVFLDRKFAATPGQLDTVIGMCRAMGTQNVVYAARPEAR